MLAIALGAFGELRGPPPADGGLVKPSAVRTRFDGSLGTVRDAAGRLVIAEAELERGSCQKEVGERGAAGACLRGRADVCDGPLVEGRGGRRLSIRASKLCEGYSEVGGDQCLGGMASRGRRRRVRRSMAGPLG